MKLLITFIILNVANVIIQTIKSIVTVKCGKVIASIINAIAYGLYTVVVVYTVCELPLWLKTAVVGVVNLFGVYIVKLAEEKMRKDKLWKVEATIKAKDFDGFCETLSSLSIPFNFVPTNDSHLIVNIFCDTQKDSHTVKEILNKFNAKYFVSETRPL